MRQKISPAEPVTALRHVKIHECGEPLVDFLELCKELRLDTPRFNYRRETVLRRGAAERLCKANELLMSKSLRILVIEGWRAPHIQRRMYAAVWKQFQELRPELSEPALRRLVNRYTAPMNERVPPPHTTGGAIDIALADLDGRPLNLHAPYDWRDPKSFAFDAPGLSERAQRSRHILAEAMNEAGLTNYPSEYWHWTYGDQGWAYRGSHPYAIYGAVEPENWQPDPADVRDEALRFLEDESKGSGSKGSGNPSPSEALPNP